MSQHASCSLLNDASLSVVACMYRRYNWQASLVNRKISVQTNTRPPFWFRIALRCTTSCLFVFCTSTCVRLLRSQCGWAWRRPCRQKPHSAQQNVQRIYTIFSPSPSCCLFSLNLQVSVRRYSKQWESPYYPFYIKMGPIEQQGSWAGDCWKVRNCQVTYVESSVNCECMQCFYRPCCGEHGQSSSSFKTQVFCVTEILCLVF